jgi:heptosyltransferase-2
VIAPNWLGDATMATPFILALRRICPDHDIDLLCRTYVADVFRFHSAVDRVLEYHRDGGIREAARVLRRSRPERGWEICFVLPPSFSSALLGRLSGARRRIGYGGQGRGLLLSDALPPVDYHTGHLSTAYLRLTERVTDREVGEVPYPVVVPPYDWSEVVKSKGLTGSYYVIAPGATYGGAKVWPADRYAELAGKLAGKTGWTVVAVGTESERAALEELIVTSGTSGVNLAGKCTVHELLAVLRGAALVIGNDSGPVHLSAAVGRPTVAIFGSTSTDWTAPRGTSVAVISAAVDCAPCFKRECPEGDARCMGEVTVDGVFSASMKLIEEGSLA